MRSLLSYLGCRFFPLITLNISCHSLLDFRICTESSAFNLMWFPFYVICCFSLAAFNISYLCLIFVNLINVCLIVFPFGFLLLWDSLLFWDLIDYFLTHVRVLSDFNLFKNIFRPFLFLFLVFFQDPKTSNIGAFNIVPPWCFWGYPQLFSFLFFILLVSSYFHHSIFQVYYPVFCKLFCCLFLLEHFEFH